MKKIVFAAALASATLFGLSVQAAPLTADTAAVQNQVAQQSVTTEVQYWHGRHRSHWRWGSRGGGGHWRWGSHGGWGGGWGHHRHRSHWRWGSHGRW